MPRTTHPLSGTEYERLEDGTVRVRGKGQEGIFDSAGNWLRGERRTADPGLCSWVSHGYRPKESRVVFDAKQMLQHDAL